MKDRGLVFIATFNPLCVMIIAALGVIVLYERIYLRSVIGTIFKVIGLYGVVWEKSKDSRKSSTATIIGGSSEENEDENYIFLERISCFFRSLILYKNYIF